MLLEALARNTRKGDLAQRVKDMPLSSFSALLEQVTAESEQLLRVLSLSQSHAFESMLDQVLGAFTLKIGRLLSADKATLFVRPESLLRGQTATGILGSIMAAVDVPLGSTLYLQAHGDLVVPLVRSALLLSDVEVWRMSVIGGTVGIGVGYRLQ